MMSSINVRECKCFRMSRMFTSARRACGSAAQYEAFADKHAFRMLPKSRAAAKRFDMRQFVDVCREKCECVPTISG